LMIFYGLSWLFFLLNYLVEKSNSLEYINKSNLFTQDKLKNM